jgi:NADPH:quinone reductase-like Zn-dependent oxidoreductase
VLSSLIPSTIQDTTAICEVHNPAWSTLFLGEYLRTSLSEISPLADATAAHEELESDHARGKLVLEPDVDRQIG